MEQEVLTGKSVEKILEDFCESKNLHQDEVEYKIIDEGKNGFMGLIGSKKATIRIISYGRAKKIKIFLETLIKKMDIDFEEVSVEENDDSISLRIIGSDDPGFLIGKEARFLNNLQYLINRAFENREESKRIYIDVDNYKERQAENIIKKYEPIFNKVIDNQKPYTLEPLDPNFRRVIHQHLESIDEISTLTIGDGKRKRIVIFPKDYDQTKIRKRSYMPQNRRNNNYRNNDYNSRNNNDYKARRNDRYNSERSSDSGDREKSYNDEGNYRKKTYQDRDKRSDSYGRNSYNKSNSYSKRGNYSNRPRKKSFDDYNEE